MSGSDTDGSDSESSSERSLYARVRLEALQCLHGLAVSNAQLLHTSWLGLLPVCSVESRSPRDATLVDIILKDPVVKVSQWCVPIELSPCFINPWKLLGNLKRMLLTKLFSLDLLLDLLLSLPTHK